ncbi:dynein regulatory complex subunit 7 [Nematostella vectensis]|uniref:dynein regulatory complex subunit 7 n=1 Tax=Nematostella vectensis TaxID=45351 RepID=UPI00207775A5|nr:dynein regulatory complex subunit 7 [Nematostella vectensis]
MESLQKELAKIKVTLPDVADMPSAKVHPNSLPGSYKTNNPQEKLVLSFAENFRRQFVHLYRDRRPLLLNPVNECGVEKFICTYIRATLLPYKEIYDYDGCAQFVSDYLTFEPLDPPIDLPSKLCSSTSVLKKQQGNCFEFSTLLCSLLIGSGYDAYCVCGYATRETTLMDESREVCPLLRKKDEVTKSEEKKEMKKYSVKPPKDLRSRFEAKLEEKARAEEEAKEKKRKEEDATRIAELEKPKPDKLHGLRVHCWVLVLSGKREVPESFFIESLTGTAHQLNHSAYLGIESVWNDKNYWVNMQDCSNGVQDLVYDLGDASKWEFMFPGTEKPLLSIPTMEDEPLDFDDDENEDETSDFDLPPSWVLPIEMSLKDFQTRCPYGKKIKLYKKAKLEKFAEYLLKDGLISRLSNTSDYELKDLLEKREVFEHRNDKLESRVYDLTTGINVEIFAPGRLDCLHEHTYKANSPGPETERTMTFYASARIDGLVKREETPEEMIETYVDRDDYLYYCHVTFGKRVKKFGPQDNNVRPIMKIVERFHRNASKPANEDVAERVFLLMDERINLTFHLEDNRVTASTREFARPPHTSEKGGVLTMTPDMTTSFQVDPLVKPPKNLHVYDMLVSLVEAEEKCIQRVRLSEEEVKEILQQRIKEEAAPQLSVSVYDTERNEKAKLHRQELERKMQEEAMKKHETELDYLAPFLAQIGDPPRISRQEAYKLKEECLQDLKQRLIDKANLIQARFEKETQELQRKQSWYQQNQISMTNEDEEEYLNFCSEAMFRIHILEQRLNRHKELAPTKYMQLEQKLRTDPRLAEYF